MTTQLEHTGRQIRASYKIPANVRLARAIFPIISWGTYDPYAAHRWALKLIKANPQSVEETIAALVNYDWMIEGAQADYEDAPADSRKRKQWDGAFAAYTAWAAKQREAA